MVKRHLLILLLFVSVSCAKAPPNLAPDAVPIWNANESIVALTTLGQSIRGLNAIQVCPKPDPSVGGIIPCTPLVSDNNTRVAGKFLTAAISSIKAFPDGWQATSLAAIDGIAANLDALGLAKLRPYLDAARTVLRAIL